MFALRLSFFFVIGAMMLYSFSHIHHDTKVTLNGHPIYVDEGGHIN